MIPLDTHLHVGSLLFEGIDQIDLTGPFEVLSRIPNATYRIYGKTAAPVRDLKGLWLTPDATLADAPPLDVLHVPGGFGQEALMEDTEVLDWIRQQAAGACSIFSVCTGALLCGAAGLLKGRRATTHWASFHLLPYFGAIPVNERVVVDGAWVFAAGVTAGIDGALRLAAELRGRRGRTGNSTSHGLCARAALRQRHARDSASRTTGARAPIGAGHHGAARANGAACCRQTGHCRFGRERGMTLRATRLARTEGLSAPSLNC
jgi:cyclohexyl-isocyanide hydratase